MNPFSNWTRQDVENYNARVRMKTAKQHNAELVGEYSQPLKTLVKAATALDVEVELTPAHIKTLKAIQQLKARLPEPGKRIRQGEPKIRPWEQEWKSYLESVSCWHDVKAQSIRVRLANGAWYKPDVSATQHGKLYCWEIKGGKKMKGVAKGTLALKVAASQYPEIVWTLVWKEHGQWKQQQVLP